MHLSVNDVMARILTVLQDLACSPLSWVQGNPMTVRSNSLIPGEASTLKLVPTWVLLWGRGDEKS